MLPLDRGKNSFEIVTLVCAVSPSRMKEKFIEL